MSYRYIAQNLNDLIRSKWHTS